MKSIDTSKLDLKLGSEYRYWLINLKKKTKVSSMNILCRWALCLSLSESTILRDIEENKKEETNSELSIEIRWETFTGRENEIYLSLLKQYCLDQEIDITEPNLQKIMRLHVQRGLGYLKSDINNPEGLISILN